jgi:hypothetical protein
VKLLETQLQQFMGLESSQRVRLIQLCGKERGDMFEDPELGQWNRLHLATLARPGTDPLEEAVGILGGEQPESMGDPEFRRRLGLLVQDLPDKQAARAQLQQKVAAMRADLTERLELIRLREERDLQRAIEQAKIDAGLEGAKRRRIEVDLDRMRRMSHKELRALKATRLKEEDGPPSGPARGQGRDRPGTGNGAASGNDGAPATGTGAATHGAGPAEPAAGATTGPDGQASASAERKPAVGEPPAGAGATATPNDRAEKFGTEPTCQNGSPPSPAERGDGGPMGEPPPGSEPFRE